IKTASEVHSSKKDDAWSDLPTIERLEQAFDLSSKGGVRVSDSLFVMFIDVSSFKQIHMTHGPHAADEALRLVAQHTRAALQPTDVLFRYGVCEFVALLGIANTQGATALADGISESLKRHPLILRTGAVTIDVTATVIKAPQDTTTLGQLIAAAREHIG